MAGAGEVLEKARELYIKMGEATRTLAQAAGAAEQDYQRLREHTHLTIAALTTLLPAIHLDTFGQSPHCPY